MEDGVETNQGARQNLHIWVDLGLYDHSHGRVPRVVGHDQDRFGDRTRKTPGLELGLDVAGLAGRNLAIEIGNGAAAGRPDSLDHEGFIALVDEREVDAEHLSLSHDTHVLDLLGNHQLGAVGRIRNRAGRSRNHDQQGRGQEHESVFGHLLSSLLSSPQTGTIL